jgi:hypothetical protein
MFKRKKVYFWPLPNNKKVIVVEEPEVKKKEFKNIIKQEENLD